ncbi:MAG: TonB family protein [Acidobacteriota bacterium]|nr:TonB family protein [Acidobacteriota bacterium]
MSKSNYTVLNIDYEPKSIESTRSTLEKAGLRVEVAEDGVAGLEAFDRVKPDIVLIEAMLPKKHGFEVCQEIKKSNHGKNVPVVITTGVYRGRKYRTQALHIYGADEYLEKPIPEEKLVSMCKEFLARSGKTMDAPAPEMQAQSAVAVNGASPTSPTADVTEQEIMERLDALLPGEELSEKSEIAAAPADVFAETAETPQASAAATPVIHGSAVPTPALEPTPLHEEAEAGETGEGDEPETSEASQVVQFPTKHLDDDEGEVETQAEDTVSDLESQLEEITEKLADDGPDDDSMISASVEETTAEPEEVATETGTEDDHEAEAETVQEVEAATEPDTLQEEDDVAAVAEPTDGEMAPEVESKTGKSRLVWIVAAIVIVAAVGATVFFVMRGRAVDPVPIKTQASTPRRTPESRPRPQAVFPSEPQMAEPATSDPESAPNEIGAPTPIPIERRSPKPEPESTPPPAAEETAKPVAADPKPAAKNPTPAVHKPDSKPAATAEAKVDKKIVQPPPVTTPTETKPEMASSTTDATPEPAATPPGTETFQASIVAEPGPAEPTPAEPAARQQVVTEPEPVPEPEPARGTQRGDLVDILEVDTQPVAVTRVSPTYPAIARRAGHEGTVVLNVLIDDKGRVEVVEVIMGVGRDDMDQAAIQAVAQWKFEPGIKDDVPVRVWKIEKVVFKL